MAIPAVRLNHAVLYVTDVDRSKAFWSTALDLEIVHEIPGVGAFMKLRRSTNDHDLAVFQVGDQGRMIGRPPGLYHLAWQVDTIDDLSEARTTLIELGAYVGESSHGTTKSIYAKDPDGIEFEVMWMLPIAHRDDEAMTTERLDLDAEVARWSGVGTADDIEVIRR